CHNEPQKIAAEVDLARLGAPGEGQGCLGHSGLNLGALVYGIAQNLILIWSIGLHNTSPLV
ncbi:hypothetical protein KI387_043014, partial [Taxus chinensis]